MKLDVKSDWPFTIVERHKNTVRHRVKEARVTAVFFQSFVSCSHAIFHRGFPAVFFFLLVFAGTV